MLENTEGVESVLFLLIYTIQRIHIYILQLYAFKLKWFAKNTFKTFGFIDVFNEIEDCLLSIQFVLIHYMNPVLNPAVHSNFT